MNMNKTVNETGTIFYGKTREDFEREEKFRKTKERLLDKLEFYKWMTSRAWNALSKLGIARGDIHILTDMELTKLKEEVRSKAVKEAAPVWRDRQVPASRSFYSEEDYQRDIQAAKNRTEAQRLNVHRRTCSDDMCSDCGPW